MLAESCDLVHAYQRFSARLEDCLAWLSEARGLLAAGPALRPASGQAAPLPDCPPADAAPCRLGQSARPAQERRGLLARKALLDQLAGGGEMGAEGERRLQAARTAADAVARVRCRAATMTAASARHELANLQTGMQATRQRAAAELKEVRRAGRAAIFVRTRVQAGRMSPGLRTTQMSCNYSTTPPTDSTLSLLMPVQIVEPQSWKMARLFSLPKRGFLDALAGHQCLTGLRYRVIGASSVGHPNQAFSSNVVNAMLIETIGGPIVGGRSLFCPQSHVFRVGRVVWPRDQCGHLGNRTSTTRFPSGMYMLGMLSLFGLSVAMALTADSINEDIKKRIHMVRGHLPHARLVGFMDK
ncbi:unnamed protein product [Protopolystoma xenopodis]|uniref:Uncharacterized protein n=1 Tax=Protopolystoma xenopodis TaxID=117903 RepID=A0A448XIA1_9PLAT|nr:unnamed protein product [Protopolystoma xenopodis]